MNKYVYLIQSLETSRYKIGISIDPSKRIKRLQTGNSEELKIVGKFYSEYPYKVEKTLHNIFSHLRKRGEWFDLSIEEEVNFTQFCTKIEDNIKYLTENENFFISKP